MLIKNNPKYCYKLVKNNSKIRAGIGPLQDEEGNLEPSNKKMSELLNEQYNSVFSTLDRTMTIKYPKDFFGHPEGNTLSDINITREDIIDIIKTISQTLLEAQMKIQQYFSNKAVSKPEILADPASPNYWSITTRY